MAQQNENRQWFRILSPRGSRRYAEGRDNLSDASVGAMLIAKCDQPERKVKQGEIYVCARGYEPLCSRGCVHVWDAKEDVEAFVRRAWGSAT